MIEFYFQMTLTESEHSCYHYDLERYLAPLGIKISYYRKLKTGHVPCQREIKITGPRGAVKNFARGWKKDSNFFSVEEFWARVKESKKLSRS